MFTVKKQHNDVSLSNRKSGYTLIELAVVMIIIGVLLAPLAAAYSSYMKKKAFEVTEDNISLVTTTIGSFRGMNGRYPCPASLTADRDDPEYGREGDCTDVITIGIGECTHGVCVKQSARTLAGAPIRVRVGALPFRQLNISENTAYDGYGYRLTYVLTESLGDKDRFKMDEGGIGVVDTKDPPVSVIGVGPNENTAHFLILSHGKNGAGAHLRTGALNEPCGTLSAAEDLNCQDATTPPIYRQAQYSTAPGAQYYDDTISYFVRGEVSPWLVNPTNQADVYLKDLSDEAKVGIDITNDDPLGDRSKINSIVRARTDVKANLLCDQGGGNCTYASLIAGEDANMKCPTGYYMVGISHNKVQCREEIYKTCGAGEVVNEVKADGTIVCGAPPIPPKNCLSDTVRFCSANHTLPAGNHGSTYTINAGVSLAVLFRCNNGIWSSQSQTGVCTCTPRTESRNQTCGTGFEGGIAQTRTYQCPQGVWTAWTTIPNGNTCRCVGRTEDRTRSCPTPEYTGGIKEQRTFTCNAAGTSGTWSSWTTIPGGNTCVCPTVPPRFRAKACGGGLTGSYQETQTFSCGTNSWSAWSAVPPGASVCKCNARADETRTQPCPSGYTGNIYESRKFQCPGATWSSWAETSRDCKAVPIPVCTWKATGSGNDQTTKRGSRVGDQCTCGASGQCHEVVGANLYYNYSSCSCQ